jgi:hypothetical protein
MVLFSLENFYHYPKAATDGFRYQNYFTAYPSPLDCGIWIYFFPIYAQKRKRKEKQ